MIYAAPRLLDESHDLDSFVCTSQPSLEVWLKRRARKSHASGGARVFVVTESEDRNVIAYYALAAGSVKRDDAPGRLSRNMPDPIPVVVLARLAVHSNHERRGLGRGLLKDAVLRSQRLSEEMGIRAMLCHAIDAKARAFYVHHGFYGSPIDAMTLLLPLR